MRSGRASLRPRPNAATATSRRRARPRGRSTGRARRGGATSPSASRAASSSSRAWCSRAAAIPLPRTIVDLWHADDKGEYDNKGFRLRGHQLTDAAGRYRFRTIVPAVYTGRTRHFHVKVAVPERPVLTTQLYFPDEPGNAQDFLFRRELSDARHPGGRWARGAVRFRHRYGLSERDRWKRRRNHSRSPRRFFRCRGTSSTATRARSPGGSRSPGRSWRWCASPAAAWCRRRSWRASSASA